MKELIIQNNGAEVKFESSRNFVIVGANGSGKSHLGASIERQFPKTVLRISAQRALSVPDRVNINDYESTWNEIQYGNAKDRNKGYKWGFDGNEDTIRLINDYEKIISAVFAYQHNEEHDFYNNSKNIVSEKGVVDEVPERITDRICAIWNEVLPQRQLEFETAKVNAICDEYKYQAKYMSDGERVALYLISQCLLAPKGMTIVVDEPEIHLHRTIMTRLWDTIERFCEDKYFVYITHDLEFAASRKESTKIWCKAFHGINNLELELLPNDDNIPEELMLEVLGNRKPVLFVEGEKNSYDYQLYKEIYADKYVIPAHNCTKVIELTKAFNNDRIRNIHHLNVKGLIDRDYLSQHEIDSYSKDGVFTLNVAEVENLYLIEPILRIVAEHMALDPDVIVEKVKSFVFSEFVKEKSTQLKELCSRSISFRLQQFQKPQGDSLQELKDALIASVGVIDVDKIYADNQTIIDEIISTSDYQRLLYIYNRKSLSGRVSHFFGLANNKYPDLVLNLLKTNKRKEIIDSLKSIMPNI